jgi:sugar/nucleoside kinase (ribokinase family)
VAAAETVSGIAGRRLALTGVVCCGNVVFDILVRPVDAVVWNTTRWVDSIDTSLGGNGANTAAAVAALGVPARLVSAVGRDAFGERALERLRELGVDLSGVMRGDGPTSNTVVLVRDNGDRMFLHRPGVSAEAFAEPLVFERDCGFFHLGNAFALPNMRRNAAATLRAAVEAGYETSMDAGWDARGEWLDVLGPALPHTGLLFVNEDEALRLSGRDAYGPAAERLRELGARTVVVKRGAAGCSVFHAGGRSDEPAYEVQAVDTTGAGDCFAGAFLAARARGLELREAARVANAIGAMNVERIGATTGLRGWEETLEWMRAARVRV